MTSHKLPTSFQSPDLGDFQVLGKRDWLSQPGISLCGSRSAGEGGIEFARRVGGLAAELELPLISGYAKGVDLAGHVACVEAGGHTIAVLAEELGRFRLRRELRAVIEPWDEVESHLTVVSEFEHNARWTVWRAMKRNALICSLGRILVAIDPGDTGGTIDAVKKAIKCEIPVIIGWSNPEASREHLSPMLANPRVVLSSTQHDLLAAIEEALPADGTPPAVSQPHLL